MTDDLCSRSNGGAIRRLLKDYVSADDYSARLYEVALHSVFQILDEEGVFEGTLKPLSQMRSANKKHKNVGDIEIEIAPDSRVILEAWDAKFGKVDLRDEVEELFEKLKGQPECRIAGFVTDQEPNISESLSNRILEIEDELGGSVSIKIMSFQKFVDSYIASKVDLDSLSKRWLVAFVECLAQRRRTQAPIDEPCHDWLRRYVEFVKSDLAPQ